jgi:hypothetical protein
MAIRPRGGIKRDDSWRPESASTYTENWTCQCEQTHSLSRRRMLEILDEHEDDPPRVVVLIFGRDL